ncbi:putative Ribosome assembly protein rrb1 [Blattamonas nauphoetae]|uniref:Glutamate-rich WD repeat-containing protein 1 n=1 Tax=Blattamonas nauphoetae TaxID=2049346 RepID=A0ABQ9YLS9_9EUKA|nr:putative Ribosome assembly protein rrb1 [Blattamonas nauphoetae]
MDLDSSDSDSHEITKRKKSHNSKSKAEESEEESGFSDDGSDSEEEIIPPEEGADLDIRDEEVEDIVMQAINDLDIEEKQKKQKIAAEEHIFYPGDRIEEGMEMEYDRSQYDTIHSFNPGWPSLSFDYLRPPVPALPTTVIQYPLTIDLLMGTQTDRPENNFLNYLHIKNLSYTRREEDDDDMDDDDDDLVPEEKLFQIRHRGDVNRVRCMPQDSSICATWSSIGEVNIFDVGVFQKYCAELDQQENELLQEGLSSNKKKAMTRNKRNEPKSNQTAPVGQMKHPTEGWGMNWSQINKGKIVTADNSGFFGVWSASRIEQFLFSVSRAHSSSIEDVKFNPTNDNHILTASSDGTIKLWDTRNNPQGGAAMTIKNAHNSPGAGNGAKDVNTIDWNPFVETLFASGGDDHSIRIWDVRQPPNQPPTASLVAPSRPAVLFRWHNDQVTQVEWSPHNDSMLLATGGDCQTSIWDLSMQAEAGEQETVDRSGRTLPPQFLASHMSAEDQRDSHWHTQYPGNQNQQNNRLCWDDRTMQPNDLDTIHLTNFEYVELFAERKDKRKPQPFEWTFLDYLGKTPILNHTRESVISTLQILEKKDLSTTEKIQIINMVPTSTTDLKLIISDWKHRFTEEDLEYLLYEISPQEEYATEEEPVPEGENQGIE